MQPGLPSGRFPTASPLGANPHGAFPLEAFCHGGIPFGALPTEGEPLRLQARPMLGLSTLYSFPSFSLIGSGFGIPLGCEG
jgi:hypothetical protein